MGLVGTRLGARLVVERSIAGPLTNSWPVATETEYRAAVGCCTSPPGSRSPPAAPSCTSPRPGRGPRRSNAQLNVTHRGTSPSRPVRPSAAIIAAANHAEPPPHLRVTPRPTPVYGLAHPSPAHPPRSPRRESPSDPYRTIRARFCPSAQAGPVLSSPPRRPLTPTVMIRAALKLSEPAELFSTATPAPAHRRLRQSASFVIAANAGRSPRAAALPLPEAVAGGRSASDRWCSRGAWWLTGTSCRCRRRAARPSDCPSPRRT